MQSRIRESFIFAVALIVFGILLYGAVIQVKNRERIVSVRGLAEREVPVNSVIWPIVYNETGDDIVTLYEVIQNKNQKVEQFLISNGIQKEEISYSTPEITDTELDGYRDNKPTFRYSAMVVVTVVSKNVALVREVMSKESALFKQGIALKMDSYEHRPIFEFTNLNEIKPSMIEEATKNARQSALQFAKDSESSLGKIKEAAQGQFTISDRDAHSPHIKTIRVVTHIKYFLED